MNELAATTPARRWTVEGFRTFWAKPSVSFLPTIRQVATDDIVGHWPRPIGDIADPDLYLGVIADILAICPDWTLAVPEEARSGNLHFIRWIATGTDENGRFEFVGCDRVKLDVNGRVCENFVFCDLSCTRFRRHRVRCFMEQEVCHGETAVYARVQA